jgi:hypothetical protein
MISIEEISQTNAIKNKIGVAETAIQIAVLRLISARDTTPNTNVVINISSLIFSPAGTYSLLPQFIQNLAVDRFSVPHFLHIIPSLPTSSATISSPIQ